jgi:selenoprotein W-related protein
MAGREFLGAFGGDLGEIALVPAAGDVFMIRISGETAWGQECGGIPGRAAVKRGVRDCVVPGWDSGRSDCQDAKRTDRTGQARHGIAGRTAQGPRKTGIPVLLVSLD